MKTWQDIRERFRSIVFRRGVNHVANAIPADRVTVFRLVNGTTERPSLAVRAGIERLIDREGEDNG